MADDDERNIQSLSRVLRKRGLDVVVAYDGQMALDMLDEHDDISLVLMDIMMPKMDGYQAMREIRSQNRFVDLPIIALTARSMSEERETCISAGANDYLRKPVDLDDLLVLIQSWLFHYAETTGRL